MKEKFILDACCGPRMFWFDKHHPNTLYIDNRIEEKGFIGNRQAREIKPDKVMDFRDLKFPDKSFKLVVMDPPHLKNMSKNFLEGERSDQVHQFRLGDTFGYLDKRTWGKDLRKGFKECWRVLDDYGILIFKWNDHDIKVKDLLMVLGRKPLFGHRTRFSKNGRSGTHWFCFMKIPNKKSIVQNILNENRQKLEQLTKENLKQ